MNTTHRIRMIVAVAVALTIAVAGIASASPPVQPPNETSIITTTVTIECHGTVTEVEDLDGAYSFIPGDVTEDNGDWNDDLAQGESVAQIQYSENLKAVDGFTQFTKDFKWDGENGPNLGVDKRIAYVEDTSSAISWVDNTENVGMTIVTEGDDSRVGEDAAALCVFAQDVCIPPTNELVSAGSQLYMVDLVSATTKTSVSTTESPRLAHRITGTGIKGYGAYVDTVLGPEGTLDGPYGVGTISAGMKVSSQEGRGCDYGVVGENHTDEYYPMAGELTYDEMTTAKGYWDFDKSMTYEAQIVDVNIPRSWRIFNLPV
ncbi:MAG: hypothetical protein C5S38_00925 [Candidatus Methanophagaceae archaeon]|nr:MAG: hypothetical protein C5S38_00925 [Methanophagales archaeon]